MKIRHETMQGEQPSGGVQVVVGHTVTWLICLGIEAARGPSP
jgi:hypothetical protein